jgi:HAE1 family hydrophobic/amphiphilic exporter-1
MRIPLRPQSERNRSSEQVAADLRAKLKNVPGVKVRTRAGQGLFIMRMAAGADEKVQVEVRGYDLETADALAREVQAMVEKVPGVTDARVSRESGAPEETIRIDRHKAADMKLTVSQIANVMQTVLSGTQAGDFRDAGKMYPIMVKVKDSERSSVRDLLDLTLTNADGEPVVLRNVVQPKPRTGPTRIERKDQERVVIVSANTTPDRDLGSIIRDVQDRLHTIPRPLEFNITFGGDYEDQVEAFQELLLSLALSLILVYMVMACQYESLRDPFIVMFSVPLGGIGVILLLFLTRTTLNVQSFIGCIMLGGIVVNNAILLVDHTNLLRRRDGMALRAAIEEAGRRRLRPILMTSLTTILGLLPLALGVGEGGEAQAPLARAVIGGLTTSTFITLVFVPVIYSLFEREAHAVASAEAAK